MKRHLLVPACLLAAACGPSLTHEIHRGEPVTEPGHVFRTHRLARSEPRTGLRYHVLKPHFRIEAYEQPMPEDFTISFRSAHVTSERTTLEVPADWDRWTDGGRVTVTYRADVEVAMDESGAAVSSRELPAVFLSAEPEPR